VDYAHRPGGSPYPESHQKQGDNLNDPFIKSSFSVYTEQGFAEFIDEIRKEDKAPTDERADVLVRHFNEVVGHPSGMDLIYYPEPGADTSSAGIARTIAAWRVANGLPGFKQ
jgi:hypothetical protein